MFSVNSVIYNNNLFIYSALFNMLSDQKRITTINTGNLKTINTNIKIIQTYCCKKTKTETEMKVLVFVVHPQKAHVM